MMDNNNKKSLSNWFAQSQETLRSGGNANLYPDLPDNKSINLIKFEEALETMEESKAVFETVTGKYSKSRDFNKVKEIKKLTEAEDGVYGYEVIFTKQ